MHTDTVAATLNEDKLAIDVYQYAEMTGERITLGLVERRLDELRSHDPDCGCGLCAAAHAARAQGVYYVAHRWAGGIAADQPEVAAFNITRQLVSRAIGHRNPSGQDSQRPLETARSTRRSSSTRSCRDRGELGWGARHPRAVGRHRW
jgi:hypothetical protein